MAFILDSSDYPGHIKDFSGILLANHLPCDGLPYLKASYPQLNAILSAAGYPWGSDATHFNTPPPRMVAVGAGGAGTGILGNVLGNTGGEETHLLTSGESGLRDHSHHILAGGSGGTHLQDNIGVGTQNTYTTEGVTGGALAASDAHNNIQPSMIVTKQIRY